MHTYGGVCISAIEGCKEKQPRNISLYQISPHAGRSDVRTQAPFVSRDVLYRIKEDGALISQKPHIPQRLTYARMLVRKSGLPLRSFVRGEILSHGWSTEMALLLILIFGTFMLFLSSYARCCTNCDLFNFFVLLTFITIQPPTDCESACTSCTVDIL